MEEGKNRGNNPTEIKNYELSNIYIYTHTHTHILHIEEVDINKKSNVNLICNDMKLKSKSKK